MSDAVSMLRYHREGLRRFSGVIDGTPNYDDLLEHKLTASEWMIFDSDVDISEKRDAAVSLFERNIRSRKHNIIDPVFSGFCCDGNTKNNIREFKFFDQICSNIGIRILEKNYAKCPKISIYSSKNNLESYIKILICDSLSFYNERLDISASIVHQQILYSRSFLSFLLSFSQENAIKPIALVQANDHSPTRVAMSMIMKGLGVPRIYLQHAEITSHFPSLDFEYSVLRNRNSLNTYKEIGPIRGNVYIISRYDDIFRYNISSFINNTELTAVIYPTARVLIEGLQSMIAELEKNPKIGKILIKQHPGAAKLLSGSFASSNVTVVTDIPSEEHIAVVGNSSVVIELLHRGIPVYQNFDFDPIDADYYGFVKCGLTKEVGLREFSDVFWKPYDLDERWLKTFADWDPSADTTHLEEQAHFVEEMARLAREVPASVAPIAGSRMKRRLLHTSIKSRVKEGLIKLANANPRASARAANLILNNANRAANFLSVNAYRAAKYLSAHTEIEVGSPIWRSKKTKKGNRAPSPRLKAPKMDLFGFIEKTLCDIKDPAEWLQLNEHAQAIPTVAVITALEKMFQNRSPALNIIFDGLKEWSPGSAAYTWTYLKKIDWGNFDISRREIDEIAEFVYTYQENIEIRQILEQSILLTILRNGTCEQIDDFWRNAIAVRKDRLSINQSIQFLRKLRGTPSREEEANQILCEIEKRASPFEMLKLRNMDALEGRQIDGWGHAYAEQQFAISAPREISREFATFVQPVYETLRPRMRFMDARTDATVAEAFLSLIRNSITSKRPFSMIRLSDGEGYLFPEGDFFSEADIANRERHWWGRQLDAELRAQIIAQARRSLAIADVVGIPAIYRFIRDHGDTSRSLTQTVQGRGLLQVLQGVGGATPSEALIAEDKLNVSLFSDVTLVTSLAEIAGKVIIVGSVKVENLPQKLRKLPQIEVIALPTHARTSLNGKYNAGSEPLPFVYQSLLDKLDALATPGDLVLVAGGIVGKIFVGRARERGAVALDIGSVLDDWIVSGMHSMR